MKRNELLIKLKDMDELQNNMLTEKYRPKREHIHLYNILENTTTIKKEVSYCPGMGHGAGG